MPRVVVVGAGIIGASLAWHLTRGGAHVTIVADDVGGTATPCSFAWLNASWNNPRFYYDLRLRSMARWKRLAEEVPGLQSLLRWEGGLGVSVNLPPPPFFFLFTPFVFSFLFRSRRQQFLRLSVSENSPSLRKGSYYRS